MDSAKEVVKSFMNKAGKHDTTVHERVDPAVTRETVDVENHNRVQTALDREVHQDHYHTSVQPVSDSERLPEQHHHNLVPVEHKSFEHGNDREVQDRLAQESAQFRDERIEGETREKTSVNPVLAGEHVHHHVHETIQPVVHKQTVEPHVIHTTVPVHEVHHNKAKHHAASNLPAVSMQDFKSQGGVLGGREERYDGFEGEPKAYAQAGSGTGRGASGLNEREGGLGSGVSPTAGNKNRDSALGSGLGSETGTNRNVV